ncbi:MAG: hypothetical protein GYB64_10315 [Chloroflexi bacterium]|nr:hypothetical protein [Chloroflexota bacterium]
MEHSTQGLIIGLIIGLVLAALLLGMVLLEPPISYVLVVISGLVTATALRVARILDAVYAGLRRTLSISFNITVVGVVVLGFAAESVTITLLEASIWFAIVAILYVVFEDDVFVRMLERVLPNVDIPEPEDDRLIK